MPASAFNLFIVLLLVFANAIFVMSEMAIVSARKVRLQQTAQQGNRRARAALKLANNPNQFLAAVQVGITLIAIVSGAFGEKTISQILQPLLNRIPGLANYTEQIAFFISIITITYLTLIIGELVPKRLALNSPEAISSVIAGPMSVVAKIAAPIVYLLSTSTDIAIKLLGIRPSDEPEITEAEIRVMIEQGTEAGMFEQAEEDIMKRVFQLGDRRISSIMTPRPEIIWLDIDDSAAETQRILQEESHARFPVCRDQLDNILGITQVYGLLRDCMAGQPLDLTRNLQAPTFVPESTRALNVLEQFKQSGNQMAFVVDEYGVIEGLVTLTDILQALVGDLPSIEELAEPQAIQREDGSWLFDGMLPIYQFKEFLKLEETILPDEERGSYQTLGGFVVMHLGKIPRSSDHFVWNGYRFEVMDMDGNRVDKVLVGSEDPS